MIFLSPIWLWALLPWSAAALLLLLRRQPDAGVPFLDLWYRNVPRESVRREPAAPPLAIVLALLAALLGILAAAGPALPKARTQHVDVILDAGNSMTALADPPAAPDTRLTLTAGKLIEMADRESLDVSVTVVERTIKPSQDLPLSQLADFAQRVTPSAIDTAGQLNQVVRRSFEQSDRPVVVLTDHVVRTQNPRLVQITPPPLGYNAAIQLAVADGPKPQAMIRLSAAGGGSNAVRDVTIEIESGGQVLAEKATLPASGDTRDLFVNLPSLGRIVQARLRNWHDAYAADDSATVVREQSWPRIEPAVNSAALQKLVRVYAAARPPNERSPVLRLAQLPEQLGDAVGILVPDGETPAKPTRPSRVADHPAAVGFSITVSVPAVADRSLPPADATSPWQTLVEDAAGSLLAVRESNGYGVGPGFRQAWTAVSPEGWATDERYVTCFAAMIDWVSGIERSEKPAGPWRNHPLTDLQPPWQPDGAGADNAASAGPGVYRNEEDGRQRAFVADRLPSEVVSLDDTTIAVRWRQALADARETRRLSPAVALLALAALLGAALAWRARPGRQWRRRNGGGLP